MPAYKHGDIINGHYTEFEQDGTMEAKGDAICWDDIYIEPADLDTATTNPPLRKLFRNDGTVGTDDAVQFISGSGAEAPAYAAANAAFTTGEYSIEFWFKPDTDNIQLVRFGSQNRIRLAGGGAIQTFFGGVNISAAVANLGAWNHLIVNVSVINDAIDIFLNGIAFLNVDDVGTINIATSYLIAPDDQVTMDLFTIYDVLFTEAQALERWNGGAGTFTLATGMLDTDRVLYCDFEDGAGSTITNTKGDDFTIGGVEGADFNWVAGAIGIPNTLGVYLPAFEAGVSQSVGFTIPIPHDYKLGSLLYPHLHFSWGAVPPAAGETISFTMEYTTSAIGQAFPLTQELTFTYVADGTEVPYRHGIASWDTIPGVTASISAEIIASLVREADTFAQDVFFINHGTHYQINMLGSREPFTK